VRILVSGFEPFGGSASNPSGDLAKLAGSWASDVGAEVCGVVLPVTFAGAWPALLLAISDFAPDAVLAMGLAIGRAELSLERIGINLADSADADNSGQAPSDQPLVPGAPDGLFATLPLRAILAAIKATGAPAGLSLSAGTYVCNAVLYRLLLHGRESRIRGGFLHLPPTPELASQPPAPAMAVAPPASSPDASPVASVGEGRPRGLPLARQEAAVKAALRALAAAGA
jgi:pyroglutamyl-peptidase